MPFDLPPVPLPELAHDPRWRRLEVRHGYYLGTQDDGKRYDWDGRIRSDGDWDAIAPGYYIPHADRRPAVQYRIKGVIVRRLSAMLFGPGSFPAVTAQGDTDTEDFARELVRASGLRTRIVEARNYGGACGTACMSWAIKGGVPRVEVHAPSLCRVLAWDDAEELRPRVAVKVTTFERQEYDERARRMVRRRFWRVRLWTDQITARWNAIPEEQAEDPTWVDREPDVLEPHGFGLCPFYWIQNFDDSGSVDGEPDVECHDEIDEMNRLLSATSKGTRSNVDPTLVIRAHANANKGVVRKGTGAVLYAEGGASYLELSGTSVEAAKAWIREIKAQILDEAGVILADPEQLAGSAQSAAALRILYAPMLARCDLLREQYGAAIRLILEDMLRVARRLDAAPPVYDEEEGARVVERVVLPPRIVEEDGEIREEPRFPGLAERLALEWPPYFPASYADWQTGTQAIAKASGGKAFLSQSSAVRVAAAMFGIEDADAELERVHEEAEEGLARMRATMGPPSTLDLLDVDDGDDGDDGPDEGEG